MVLRNHGAMIALACSRFPAGGAALASLEPRVARLTGTRLQQLRLFRSFFFDVFNDVADGLQFFRVFVRHFDPKLFFKRHH